MSQNLLQQSSAALSRSRTAATALAAAMSAIALYAASTLCSNPLFAAASEVAPTDPESFPSTLTRAQPLVSWMQMVGADAGPSEILVDEGVTRVWMDVRQPNATDAYSLIGPDGRALEQSVPLERISTKQDMSDVDLFGAWQDILSWPPAGAGRYTISSPSPHYAYVYLEGGGQLEFWIEPDPQAHIIRAGEPVTLYAAARDAAGQLLERAEITAEIRDIARDADETKTIADSFVPTAEPGIYAHELREGLPESMYGIAVTATEGDFRRHLGVIVASVTGTPMQGAGEPWFMAETTQAMFDKPPPELIEIEGGDANAVPSPQPAVTPGTVSYPSPTAEPRAHLPVILFVHGIMASSDHWRGPDGISGAALDAGYRVALIDLHRAQASSVNAPLIATGIEDAAEHFDVDKIVVVTHSKGGADTDQALMGFGTEYATTAITLAAPYTGTGLADLVYVLPPPIPVWVFPLLGGNVDTAIQLSIPWRHLWVTLHGHDWPADYRAFYFWGFADSRNFNAVYALLSGPFLAVYHAPTLGGYNDGLVPHAGAGRHDIFGHDAQVQYPLAPLAPHAKVNHTTARSRAHMWNLVLAQLNSAIYDNTPTGPNQVQAELVAESCLVQLTWSDRSLYETGFDIERASDATGGNFAPWRRVDADEDEGDQEGTLDGDIQPGHGYSYRVRAYIDDPRTPQFIDWASDWDVLGGTSFVMVPSSTTCEDRTVSFSVVVNQPPEGDPQDFWATVTLTGTPPTGDPVESEITIDQNSGGQSYTFGTSLPDGSDFDVAATVDTPPLPNGQPVADCDVGNGSGTINGHNVTNVVVTCDVSQPERYAINYEWTASTPSGGQASPEFSGTLKLSLQPPPGSSQSPVLVQLPISGPNGVGVHENVGDGWQYDLTVGSIQNGSCTGGGSGTIQGADTEPIQFECIENETGTYTVFFQYHVDTMGGGPPSGVFGAALNFSARPPPGAPGTPKQVITYIDNPGSGEPGEPTNAGGEVDQVPDGWSWNMSVGPVQHGFCAGGGSGTIQGANAQPDGSPAATFDCTEFEATDCDQVPEHPLCYQDPAMCTVTWSYTSYYILTWQETCTKTPTGQLTDCQRSTPTIRYIGTSFHFQTVRCGGEAATTEGLASSASSSGETTYRGPMVYLRNWTDGTWSGEVTLHGVARNDTAGVDEITFLVDGNPAPVGFLTTNLYDENTCEEIPAAACDATSKFVAILDTTQLSNGQHQLTVIARSPDNVDTWGYQDVGFVVDNSNNPPPGGGPGPTPPPNCNDTTAPQITLTAPQNNAQLPMNTLTSLQATASDPGGSGIQRVEWRAYGSLLGTDTSPDQTGTGYYASWTPQNPGTYQVSATAWDMCDNTKTSNLHTVYVFNPNPPPPPGPGNCGSDTTPPQITLLAPAHNANLGVNGTFHLKAEADDYNGVDRVEFHVNGNPHATDYEPASPLSHIYDVPWTPTVVGPYTIKAKAFDICENPAESVIHTVNVGQPGPMPPPPPPPPGANCGNPPTVAMTAPPEGTTVMSGTPVTLKANAGDDYGVTSVEFWRNGQTLLGADTTAPYEIVWTPTGVGSPYITAVAYDVCTSTTSAPRTINVVANPCAGDATGPSFGYVSPNEGDRVFAPDMLLITTNVSDPSGIDRVEYLVDGGGQSQTSTDQSSPYQHSWWSPPLGPFSYRAKAFDSCGNSTEKTVYFEVIDHLEPDPQPEP